MSSSTPNPFDEEDEIEENASSKQKEIDQRNERAKKLTSDFDVSIEEEEEEEIIIDDVNPTSQIQFNNQNSNQQTTASFKNQSLQSSSENANSLNDDDENKNNNENNIENNNQEKEKEEEEEIIVPKPIQISEDFDSFESPSKTTTKKDFEKPKDNEDDFGSFDKPKHDDNFGSFDKPTTASKNDDDFGSFEKPKGNDDFGSFDQPKTNEDFGSFDQPKTTSNDDFGSFDQPKTNDDFGSFDQPKTNDDFGSFDQPKTTSNDDFGSFQQPSTNASSSNSIMNRSQDDLKSHFNELFQKLGDFGNEKEVNSGLRELVQSVSFKELTRAPCPQCHSLIPQSSSRCLVCSALVGELEASLLQVIAKRLIAKLLTSLNKAVGETLPIEVTPPPSLSNSSSISTSLSSSQTQSLNQSANNTTPQKPVNQTTNNIQTPTNNIQTTTNIQTPINESVRRSDSGTIRSSDGVKVSPSSSSKINAVNESTVEQWMNGSFSLLLLSSAQKSGLVSTLTSPNFPYSSFSFEQLLNESGLNERFLSEWVKGAVSCGILMLKTENTFSLDEQTKKVFTSQSSILRFNEFLPLFYGLLPTVSESMKTGAGIPYSSYSEFASLEATLTKPRFETTLFNSYLPALGEVYTRMQSGEEMFVLDLGCGGGHASNMMASRFKNCHFYGIDIDQKAIKLAENEAKSMNLSNSHFFCADLTNLQPNHPIFSLKFDLATAFMVMHDLSNPLLVMQHLRKILKKGSSFVVFEMNCTGSLEVDSLMPSASMFYSISLFHCLPQSLTSPNSAALGTLVPTSKWKSLFQESGFSKFKDIQIPSEPNRRLYVAINE